MGGGGCVVGAAGVGPGAGSLVGIGVGGGGGEVGSSSVNDGSNSGSLLDRSPAVMVVAPVQDLASASASGLAGAAWAGGAVAG